MSSVQQLLVAAVGIVTVTVDPTSLSETYSSNGVVVLGGLTATATGGSGSYPTYLWEASDPAFEIDDPSLESIVVSVNATHPTVYSGTITCTVTDTNGTVGVSDAIPLELSADA